MTNQEIIKKSNLNQYLLARGGIWVRNFCDTDAPAVDINRLSGSHEYPIFLDNEIKNSKTRYPNVESEQFVRNKVVIISDGYDFTDKQKLLATLPKDVTIIGTNKTLAEWTLVGEDVVGPKRAMNYYVINNPFKEAINFLPINNYFPKCIASVRTYPKFLKAYKGNIYSYAPTSDKNYGFRMFSEYKIDDYRNPVCAAIGLAFRFGVQKLLTFCCDDSFVDERPGALKLDNGLWTYPQQLLSHAIIDANLYWLKQHGIEVLDHSSGPKFKYAEYISSKEIANFLSGTDNGK